MADPNNTNSVEIPGDVTGPDAPPAKSDSGDGLILGKFKSQDDLAEAYKNLEAKMGQGDTPADNIDPTQNTDPAAAATDETPADDGSREIVSKLLDGVGLKIDTFEQEFANGGKLTDESYAALEAKGFSREAVDGFIKGRVAHNEGVKADTETLDAATEIITQSQINQIYDSAGGEDSYMQMMQWASQNLTQQQQDTFNGVMDSGDMGHIELAVAGMHAKYTASTGSEPNLVGGKGATDASGDVFKSTAEVVEAMKDPRYKSDPAYIASVEAKMARSNVF